jgi:hypothetical protein
VPLGMGSFCILVGRRLFGRLADFIVQITFLTPTSTGVFKTGEVSIEGTQSGFGVNSASPYSQVSTGRFCYFHTS